MGAVRRAVALLAEVHHRLEIPPICPATHDRPAICRLLRERTVGINLGKGRLDGRDIATMPVEQIDALEAMPRERGHPVMDRRNHGRWTKSYRPGKAEMVLRNADIESRPNEKPCLFARAPRNRLGADRIRTDKPGWPMLLRRADGNNDSPRPLKIGLHFRPARMMQKHLRSIGESAGIVDSQGLHQPSQALF